MVKKLLASKIKYLALVDVLSENNDLIRMRIFLETPCLVISQITIETRLYELSAIHDHYCLCEIGFQ